jgi:hypothetical protein
MVQVWGIRGILWGFDTVCLVEEELVGSEDMFEGEEAVLGVREGHCAELPEHVFRETQLENFEAGAGNLVAVILAICETDDVALLDCDD